MAYSDYGAFVWLNNKRREDKEDVAVFASDEETFGEPSENIPSGMRIWAYLLKHKDEENNWLNHIYHGILGDGDIRVACYKQGLPTIYEATENGFEKIKYYEDGIDPYDYDPIVFKYKGYEFYFENGRHYYAKMITPEGDKWECEYDYGYGAGF